MEKPDVEGIVKVNSDSGVVNGDYYWLGNTMFFKPVMGWTAGIRYMLSVFGNMKSTDGREIMVEEFIPFYAINITPVPLLLRYSPLEGESVGTSDLVMEFQFSCSMDKESVESAVSVDGFGNKIYEWLSDDTILKIYPEKNLLPWTQYRWTIKDSAKSIDGVTIPKSITGLFITDKDRVLPNVEKVFPVLNVDGSWYPTSANMDGGLGSGQGIAIEFNKEINENVLYSIRFEPSLSGKSEFLSKKCIVYSFSKEPQPQSEYTLIVSSSTKDNEGLTIGLDYKSSFFINTPYLNVLSVNLNNQNLVEDFSSSSTVYKVKIDRVTAELTFSIFFSLPFTAEEKKNTAQKMTLMPFFPKILPPISLQNVLWTSDDRLLVTWDGLSAGSSEEAHYYKFLIPGEKAGIQNGGEMFLKNDIVIYVEAIN
jgi:hypothetical protein